MRFLNVGSILSKIEYQGVCLQLEAWAVFEVHIGVMDGSKVLSKQRSTMLDVRLEEK